MNRREFIRVLSQSLLVGAGLGHNKLYASHPREEKRPVQFVFAQIKYRGGDWNPHPLSVGPLMGELMRRTSIEAGVTRHEVRLTDPDLFSYPFLYIAGKPLRLSSNRLYELVTSLFLYVILYFSLSTPH